MNGDAMRGIDFTVKGVVRTGRGSYVVLIDESSTTYFPVQCQPFQASLVENILGEETEIVLANYGLYFSLLSVFKAHGMFPTQLSLSVGKRGGAECLLELVEENELVTKVSRIPLLLPDAVAISALGKIPMVVYGPAGSDFAFPIGKGVPKQNVFSFVCEEIAKAERFASIGSEDGQE